MFHMKQTFKTCYFRVLFNYFIAFNFNLKRAMFHVKHRMNV